MGVFVLGLQYESLPPMLKTLEMVPTLNPNPVLLVVGNKGT